MSNAAAVAATATPAMAHPDANTSSKRKQIYLGSSYDLASTYSGGGGSSVAAAAAQVPDSSEADALANGLVHAKSTGSLFSGGFKRIRHAFK